LRDLLATVSQDAATASVIQATEDRTLLIEIEDMGRGIPEEIQDHIFEPFFTTKPFGGGLELDLDTGQRVVAKHFDKVAFDIFLRAPSFISDYL
jgi:signal transduction histidine kinase